MLMSSFSLKMLLNESWDVYRNPDEVDGKVGPMAFSHTIEHGRIFPADSNTAKLIPAPLLAGGRTSDIGLAVGRADVLAGDELNEASGLRYTVQHVADWEGMITVVSLDRPTGGIS